VGTRSLARWLPGTRLGWVAMLALAFGVGGVALAEGAPPAPTRWVTDGAGLLSERTRGALDARLEAAQRASGHQVWVWIATSTGGVPVEDFSVRAFKAWRVGRAGLDDGLVLFIFTGDHHSRIEVGYGLEGVVTDAQAARILRDVLAPGLRSGDADGAVVAAVGALLGLTGGEATARGPQGAGAAADQVAPQRPLSIPKLILFGLLALAFLVLLVTHPQMALFLLASIASGGRRGGLGGSGATGGGGRSGGGGASGSW
jgi:uncharacterized protein